MAGLIYRENRVPYYQRMMQKNDGKRLWMKHPRSKMLLTPYFIILGVAVTGSLYGTVRMMFGKRTWWG